VVPSLEILAKEVKGGSPLIYITRKETTRAAEKPTGYAPRRGIGGALARKKEGTNSFRRKFARSQVKAGG